MRALTLDPDALGRDLVGAGLIEPGELERARRVAADSAERLDRVITRLGLVPERRLAERLARLLDLPLAGPDDYPDAPVRPEQLSARFLAGAHALPLALTDDGLALAMVDPFDGFARQAVALASGVPVMPWLAVPAELEAALERLYRLPAAHQAAEAAVGGAEADDETDVARLKDLASEAPLVRLVNQLIARAVDQRASDIHVEPFEAELRVRYRIDGVLQAQETLPRSLAAAVASRIKLMARLDIAERRLPQDGRIKLAVRGKPIDLRVAVTPTLWGESLVLRILDRSGQPLDLAALGLEGPGLGLLTEALARPHGIVLAAGPTGSGKTTTLYAALTRLNDPGRKVLTVEDPVEYQLPGINQIQIKPEIGLTFAQVLRATLRHDPDVLMVGEIRDPETAQVAIQAALTGHLVLSTVHTNGAAATVMRLLDLGVPDYLLAATLAAVVAQRLVRVLCPACRTRYELPASQARALGLDRVAGAGPTLCRASGCDQCRGTGYHGRVALFEVMPVDAALGAAIQERVGAASLHDLAVARGMRTLAEDGLVKAAAGITSLEEVWRVTAERG